MNAIKEDFDKKFAVFDIDGTLIRWQLYHVIVDKLASEGVLGANAKSLLREARMVWKRRENESAFKNYERQLIGIYEEALQQLKTNDFDRIVSSVIEEYKEQTYVYTRDLLRHLKAQDYFLMIISGSHHELIELIATYYGFDDWVGSNYKRNGEYFSGEKQIASHDKAGVLKQLIEKNQLSLSESIAIGDSASDIAMLELVEKPIAFNPDKILIERAKQSGWPIIVERKNVVYELKASRGSYILV